MAKFVTVKWTQNVLTKPLKVVYAVLIATLLGGLWFALFNSPDDYQQGNAVRIMYIHVPSAWMALFTYVFIGVLSFGYLVWRNPLCYLIAKSSAQIGCAFTVICLITGSIWGYPMWGKWWAWDSRMTSVLVLFFIYLGYMAMNGAFNSEEKEAKSASILALVGTINIPIIKYSVEWWNTLHQPASVFRMDGPTIDNSMLIPLGLMAVAWNCLFYVILSYRVRTALLQKKLERHIFE
jgi:heme exporter protein C